MKSLFLPHRLRVLIPLMVCTVILLVTVYQTYHQLRAAKAIIVNNARHSVRLQMHLLQSVLSESMLEGDKERARRRIADVALDHQVGSLLLTDEDHSVLLANRQEWLTVPAQRVTHYDTALAENVRANQSSLLTSSPGQFVGYYPVALSMRPGELRPQHFGTLYVEYNYSDLLASAEREAYGNAAASAVGSVFLFLLLLLVLHFFVTKRLERLLAVMKEVTDGNLEIRSNIQGEGEIATLAQTFDSMVTELARKQDELHEQAAELEMEVSERQIAQESLEEQTAILEEEIAERRKAEEQLQTTNLFNQQIIRSAQEGIIVYDRFLHYQVWNPYMEELSGVPASALLGKHPLEIFPFLQDMGIMERLEKIIAGGKEEDVEVQFPLQKSGKSGWVSESVTQLRGTDGEIIGVIETVRDISMHKATEDQLRHAQKMEAIGQLAGGIAHDFNNILQVIMGYSSVLLMDENLDEKQKGEVEQIIASSEKAVKLTKGLLAFSRKQVMDPKIHDLNEVVQQSRQFLARIIGETVQLKMVCNRTNLKVKIDAAQIEQVLVNLATNARDAMPQGGTLSIEMGAAEVDAAFMSSHGYGSPGFYAYIAVTDNGCGMDATTRKRLFEPFFTTKEAGKGTGLGMAIVYGIINQHGGFVDVFTEPGMGTCFKVYFPLLADELVAESDKPVSLLPPKRGNETVLVAEDDAEICAVFKTTLSDYGYTVILAGDGEDAVEKFSANGDKIRLLLTDLIMPKMGGREVFAAISKLGYNGKALYCSGYTNDAVPCRGELEGREELIMKPVLPMDLLRKVRELLDS